MAGAIGRVELGPVPRIAVSLFDEDPAGDARAVRALADCIELRIDGFASLAVDRVCSIIRTTRQSAGQTTPIIATVRAASEGGRRRVADVDRAALYAAVLPLVDAVDIELRAAIRDSVLAAARKHRRAVILSYHDFQGTPQNAVLEATLSKARACGPAIVKIAVAARDSQEVARLLAFTLRHRREDIITIAMGDAGAISRVFFPLAGSRLTYAYHRRPAGPGQLSLAQLHRELCRYYPAYAAQKKGEAGC